MLVRFGATTCFSKEIDSRQHFSNDMEDSIWYIDRLSLFLQCVVEINVIFLVTYPENFDITHMITKAIHLSKGFVCFFFFFSLVNSLERKSSPGIEGLNLSSFDRPMAPTTEIRELRLDIQPISLFHYFILCQIQIQILCFFVSGCF